MKLRSFRAVLAVGAAAAIALASPAVASAHVKASSPGATPGGYGVVTLSVPNESDTATTTKVSVAIPKLKSARPEPVLGWTAAVSKDPKTDEITNITWTANPGTAGVGIGEFQRFAFSAGPLPKDGPLVLPSAQSYSDGSVVDWNQPTPADGSEPEHPAPEVTFTAESTASQSDTTARWLGGAGLVVGVIGLGAAAFAFTRKKA